MNEHEWTTSVDGTLVLEGSGIEIRPYRARVTNDSLFRLWVDGHNHGLFWELDMAKEVARRLLQQRGPRPASGRGRWPFAD